MFKINAYKRIRNLRYYFSFSPNVDIQEAPLLSSQATLTVKEKPVKKTTGYKFPVTGID